VGGDIRTFSICVLKTWGSSRVSNWYPPPRTVRPEHPDSIPEKAEESVLSSGKEDWKTGQFITVAGNSVFRWIGAVYVGLIFELHKRCSVTCRVSSGNVEFLLQSCNGNVPHLALRAESCGFS